MAKTAGGKKSLLNGSVHPAKINGGINGSVKRTVKSDNISLASVSTISSSLQPRRIEAIVATSDAKESYLDATPPAVVITELSEDESELQSGRGSTEPVLATGGKFPNGVKPPGTAAAKWANAGKQVRRAVAVTQAFQRPETRQEKIRKQMYGSKAALPVVPVPVAIILLTLNVIVPGLGTIVAGLTFCCCATTYDKPDRKGVGEKIPGLVYRNILVGLAQLFTVSFLLVGWFWSIAWGVTMVQFAIEREREKKEGSDWFPDAID